MISKFILEKKLILFIILLLLFSISLFNVEAQDIKSIKPPIEKNAFKIAIFGDRTGGDPEGLKYLDQAIYEINQLRPDFVIHIGDMVQGYTRDQSEWLRQKDEFLSYMNKLSMPYYLTAGNHDVFNPFRDPKDRTFEELYKKHLSPINYSFDYKNSHFVIMYTDEAMTSKPIISEDQLTWLRSDLERSNKKNVFIFMHKPIWSYENSNWDKFHEIIKAFPVKAVFAGHFHAYHKGMNKDGIQYYNLGPLGAEAYTLGSPLTGYFHHYSILTIDDDSFNLAIVKTGSIEADDYIFAEDYNKIWSITQLSLEQTNISGWLWQPIFNAVKGNFDLYIYNPLDKEASVQVQLNSNSSLWTMTPSVIKLEIPAKFKTETKLTLSAPRTNPNKIFPPEFDIIYNFVNSKGQNVPVIVKRRALLRDMRQVYLSSKPIKIDAVKDEISWNKSLPLYNHTWVFSVYERHDKPPKIYLTRDKEYLYFFAEVMDDKYSYFRDAKKDIMSDAIVFSALINDERKDIVVFPFNEEKIAFLAKDPKLIQSEMSKIEGVDYTTRTDKNAGYYYCEGKISLSTLFGSDKLT
ncbi:MAG: metallophosphoesterase family protein, partial [Candidatus Poribacteria bacterium]